MRARREGVGGGGDRRRSGKEVALQVLRRCGACVARERRKSRAVAEARWSSARAATERRRRGRSGCTGEEQRRRGVWCGGDGSLG